MYVCIYNMYIIVLKISSYFCDIKYVFKEKQLKELFFFSTLIWLQSYNPIKKNANTAMIY